MRLLRALLAGGLLRPDGSGTYRPTTLFRQYAEATVVAPLSRARAKTVLKRAQDLAVHINATWSRSPYVIQLVAVSGSFMSRRDPLNELTLWLVLRKRPRTHARRWGLSPGREPALRQIGLAMKALSSFVVVHVVAEKEAVRRPFAVVFEAIEHADRRSRSDVGPVLRLGCVDQPSTRVEMTRTPGAAA